MALGNHRPRKVSSVCSFSYADSHLRARLAVFKLERESAEAKVQEGSHGKAEPLEVETIKHL